VEGLRGGGPVAVRLGGELSAFLHGRYHATAPRRQRAYGRDAVGRREAEPDSKPTDPVRVCSDT